MTQWLLEEACLLALAVEEAREPEPVPVDEQIAILEANANRVLGI